MHSSNNSDLKNKLQNSQECLTKAHLEINLLTECLQTLLNHSSDEVHLWKLIRDKDNNIITWELIDVNAIALESWQKNKEDVIGKTTDEIFGLGATEKFMPIVKKIVDTQQPHEWTEYFEPINQYIGMKSIPMGEYFYSIGKNVTKEKVDAQGIIDKTDFLTRTGSIAKVGGWYLDVSNNHLYWTEVTCDIHEIPRNSAPKLEDAINYYHIDDRELISNAVKQAIEKGKPFSIVARIITAKGNLKWVLAKGQPELMNGEYSRLSGVFQDITERKNRETEKKKIENQLQGIVNTIPGAIYQFVFHKEGNFSIPFMNEKATEILGFTKVQLQNPEFLFSRIHPDDFESTMQSIYAANKDQAKWTKTFRAYNNCNELIWIEGNAFGSADDQGNIVHNGVLSNISEQKEAEISLKESQKEYLNISDNIPGVVLKYKLNPDGSDQLLFISQGAQELFEVPPKEAMKNVALIWEKIHKDDVELMIPSIQKSAQELTIWEFQYRLVFPDNRVKWVDLRGVPSKLEDGSVVWDTVGLDITKQKEIELEIDRINTNLELLVEERAQKAITLSKELEKYWLAAKHSKSGVWYYNVIDNTLVWDDIMYDLYGITEEDFSGAYEAWETSLHPDDLVENVNALEKTISEKIDLNISFRINHKKSGEIRYIRAKGQVEVDENGNTIAVFGSNYDITQEMNLVRQRDVTLNQLKKAQTQLIQTEKMASLGILTSGVAHELNNPLNYIVGGYSAIEEQIEDNTINVEDLKEYVHWIKTGSERANSVVRTLNQFSKHTEDEKKVCNMHLIINDCLLILNNKVRSRIKITKDYFDGPVHILGNSGKLRQVILNVLENAIEAIENKGEITIKTTTTDADISIEISDSGCGIPKQVLGKVMVPFFTTKPPGIGTGLGLSITHSIIREHEGNIDISSQVDKGTNVKLSFPKKNSF